MLLYKNILNKWAHKQKTERKELLMIAQPHQW